MDEKFIRKTSEAVENWTNKELGKTPPRLVVIRVNLSHKLTRKTSRLFGDCSEMLKRGIPVSKSQSAMSLLSTTARRERTFKLLATASVFCG